MAFCVSEDQDRQRQVFEQIGPHTPAYAIRRAVTEAKVRVDDRRVRFVGVEAYEAEGGGVVVAAGPDPRPSADAPPGIWPIT